LGVVAKLAKWAKAQIELDLGKEFTQAMDAFVDVTPIAEERVTVGLRMGQFRVPFSRQNLLPSKTFQLPDVAYFVSSKFLIDRDIGAQLFSDFFDGRIQASVGVFNGNEPGRGQNLNSDPYFLFAARLEADPLGKVPRFEGDVRPLAERKKFVFSMAASAMKSRFEDKHVRRSYVGGDISAYWQGASIYGEAYYHVDEPLEATGPNAAALVKQMGFNGQAGYFLPIPWVREHLELVGRVEYIDPNIGVETPQNDAGERDLDQSNPTWGYMGFVVGGNLFWDRAHDLKLQASYEIRNETKRCLAGQTGAACTGAIANNLFVAQVTAGF
jgi:hypothetical protein